MTTDQEPRYNTRTEKLIRIRDLEAKKGRLEAAIAILEIETDGTNSEVDNHLEEANMDIQDAISKCYDEIARLS